MLSITNSSAVFADYNTAFIHCYSAHHVKHHATQHVLDTSPGRYQIHDEIYDKYSCRLIPRTICSEEGKVTCSGCGLKCY